MILSRWINKLMKSRYRLKAPIKATFWAVSPVSSAMESICLIFWVSQAVRPTKMSTPK